MSFKSMSGSITASTTSSSTSASAISHASDCSKWLQSGCPTFSGHLAIVILLPVLIVVASFLLYNWAFRKGARKADRQSGNRSTLGSWARQWDHSKIGEYLAFSCLETWAATVRKYSILIWWHSTSKAMSSKVANLRFVASLGYE